MVVNQDISFAEIILILRRRKRAIVTCLVVSVAAGLLYALFATPRYTATATIRVLTDDSGGTLSALASRLGGAAALMGITVSARSTTAAEYVAILRSRQLAEAFILEHELLPILSSSDEERGLLQKLRSTASRLRRAVVSSISGDVKVDIGDRALWEAYKAFDEIRSVSDMTESGLVELSFEFTDPILTAEWANAFVDLANRKIREQTIQEATRALAYLDKELSKSNIVDLRETIYGLVQAQLESIMLANARPEYAFKVIDKAVVPLEPSHPRRTFVVAFALALGGFFGVFVAFLLEAHDTVRHQL